jgi:hypothetical protein
MKKGFALVCHGARCRSSGNTLKSGLSTNEPGVDYCKMDAEWTGSLQEGYLESNEKRR